MGKTKDVENANTNEKLLREIRESIQQEGIELTKFMDMVASFADDIDEEHKRYRAAIKAMKQASGIDQYDVMKAADRQLKKLSQTESLMASSLKEKKADLNQLTARASEIDEKLGALRKQTDELVKERSLIADRRNAKDKEVAAVEESYKSVAEFLSNQIGQVKEKLNKFLSDEFKGEPVVEAVAVEDEPPLATQVETFTPSVSVSDEAEKVAQQAELPMVDSPLDAPDLQVSSPMDDDVALKNGASDKTRKQKECPSCSGTMDWYAMMKMWKCYVCGHEEKVRKKK
jgi:ABC-type transporter Mla subunit MlaD